MQLLCFEDYREPSQALAGALEIPCRVIQLHRFPDGESLVQLPTQLAKRVIICQTLNFPNDKLIELYLTAKSCRQHGVKELILVAPYLCYMRQDKAFKAGQVVSQTIIGEFISELFDHVVTVDPHLHRISRLEEAIHTISAVSLTAANLLGDYAKAHYQHAVFVGPDEESEQWVKVVAASGRFDFVVARKKRFGDRQVSVELPEYTFTNKTAVLVDDVISSGHTLAEATEKLKQAGCNKVVAMCTHALLAPGAETLLEESGVDELISCDSILHGSNKVPLAELLAETVKNLALKK